MLKKKQYDEKEIECTFCHKKIKPLLQLNRAKSEFIGARYNGTDKNYWMICQNCKTILGTK